MCDLEKVTAIRTAKSYREQIKHEGESITGPLLTSNNSKAWFHTAIWSLAKGAQNKAYKPKPLPTSHKMVGKEMKE